MLTVDQSSKVEGHMLYSAFKSMLKDTGEHYEFTSKEMGLDAVAHQAGTARMGENPATSVVNEHGLCHDVGNLYIADASVLPSVGAVNPALTVMALALRTAQFIAG